MRVCVCERARKHLCLIIIKWKVLFWFVVVYFEVLSGFRLGSGINEMSVSCGVYKEMKERVT